MNNTKDDGNMTSFASGATRDTSEGKLDMEGFTHPMVEKQFAKYMNMNRLQSDGQLRDSDNWQKGISKETYMKSLRRHHDDAWLEWRGFPSYAGMLAALCGIIFNAKGMMHEILKENEWVLQDFDGSQPTPEIAERQAKLEESDLADVLEQLYEEDGAEEDISDCPAWSSPDFKSHTGYCLDESGSHCVDCPALEDCFAEFGRNLDLKALADVIVKLKKIGD